MVAAAKGVAAGEPALGTTSPHRHLDLASFEGLVPRTTDWRGFTLRGKKETRAAE
jgi:hypothetical protein